MDTSDNARKPHARGQCIYHADVLGRELAADERRWMLWYRKATVLGASRYEELLEALSQGDRAKADTLLRLWGVRR